MEQGENDFGGFVTFEREMRPEVQCKEKKGREVTRTSHEAVSVRMWLGDTPSFTSHFAFMLASSTSNPRSSPAHICFCVTIEGARAVAILIRDCSAPIGMRWVWERRTRAWLVCRPPARGKDPWSRLLRVVELLGFLQAQLDVLGRP